MPQPHRYDAYGRPIAPLADVRQESLAERPANQRQRRFMLALLEEALLPLLHRGCYADVTLHCAISDGTVRGEISVSVTTRHQAAKEE